jgi:hypothetical protein
VLIKPEDLPMGSRGVVEGIARSSGVWLLLLPQQEIAIVTGEETLVEFVVHHNVSGAESA